jgi:hypothetical protein
MARVKDYMIFIRVKFCESIGMLSRAYRIGRGKHSVQKWARVEYASICGIQSARRRILWIPEPRT